MLTFLSVVLAQGLGTIQKPSNTKLIGGDANASVSSLVSAFVTTATVIAGIVFFIMLVIGGVQWLISGGEKAALDQARNRITNGVIGLVIVVAAVAIAAIIQVAL